MGGRINCSIMFFVLKQWKHPMVFRSRNSQLIWVKVYFFSLWPCTLAFSEMGEFFSPNDFEFRNKLLSNKKKYLDLSKFFDYCGRKMQMSTERIITNKKMLAALEIRETFMYLMQKFSWEEWVNFFWVFWEVLDSMWCHGIWNCNCLWLTTFACFSC